MSTSFKEYKGLDLTETANNILQFWEKEQIFEKSITSRPADKHFIFYEGPPSANGLPGIHHVMARAIKDIFCRYKTQKGFRVERKAGWDTHGLPIELGVEKELGITKEDIGTKISVEDYNTACKKAVMRYTDVWEDLTRKMGHWVDMSSAYITYKPKYMESVWWLLKQIYNKGLIYKGYTIQPYSPKAGTGLSSHELNQPGTYQDITDTTVVAMFKTLLNPEVGAENTIKKAFGLGDSLEVMSREEIFFLAWTTTPWTLPSNTALTVGNKIDYVMVSTYNQYTFKPINVILAKNLVSEQFSGKFKEVDTIAQLEEYKQGDKVIPYRIVAQCKGADLVGIKYEQLLPYALPYQHPENAFRVIAGDFVTTEDGTGIVHTAPTFGADDALVAKQAVPEVPPMLVLDKYDNPVPLVDLQGKFRPEMAELAGKYVKNEYYEDGQAPKRSVDVEIVIKLKEKNRAFKAERYKHSYPNCWRTDKPILYYPLDSWFIKVTEVRDRMHELNQKINWKPASTGEGRFGNWLQNANDWNLSRSRFWGIPLPIWRTEDGTEELIIGSVKELKSEIDKAITAGFMEDDPYSEFDVEDMSDANYDKIDLHKNILDEVILVSASGKKMFRESDLIDVWFDSGSMPYAQWHYPFENKDLIDAHKFYPADFIAEGVDQTRGWFYTLHAISTLVFDQIAYKNVVSNGLVLDKNGKKMSKRLGNAVDPFETMKNYGADATRWYMISNANPWDNLKFDLEGVDEVRRKFFGTLYNTYSFFALYANIDGFNYSESDIDINKRPEIDRWILSELNTLIEKVTVYYDQYEPTKATRAIQYFVTENLSNWFVRLSRRRFWKPVSENNTVDKQDKLSAYQTLYTCLIEVSKLSAPVAPFFSDQLFKDLNAVTEKENADSIHLTFFPESNKCLIDIDLERKMQKAQKIASMVLSLRKKEMIKVRQPLQRIMIPVLNQRDREDITAVASLIKSEVNVKEIELIDDASGILVKNIKPNYKVLGPRYGKDMRLIAGAVNKLSQEDIVKIENEGEITLQLPEKFVNLGLDEVIISSEDIPGWLVTNQGNLTVALDVTITNNLRKEGIARELVNRIQNLRKESGLEVTDKITLKVKKDGIIDDAILDNKEYIKNETLTKDLILEDDVANGTEIVFDKVNTKLLIVPAN